MPARASLTVTSHGSFDETLRTAIHARGLSLERLHARLLQRGLHVSMASLSNWQRGKCRPERTQSLDAVHALEEILGLPRSALVARLGPPRPRGPWMRRMPGSMTFREVTAVHSSIDALIDQIECPTSDGQLQLLSMHERVQVSPDRSERSTHTRIVCQARVDGADRYLAFHHNELGAVPDVRQASHCRIGRVRIDGTAGVAAMELLFDRPLTKGETYVIEYEFGYADGGPLATTYCRWFRHPLRDYLLQVQFDEEALPPRLYRTWQPNVTTPCSGVAELRLSQWGTVHLALQDVRPGVHGIRWEWD